jgi:hypothetical protein
MSYLGFAFFTQHNCYYVEAKGPVLDVVDGEKIACRPDHSGFFGFCHCRLGWAEILVRPGFYLDKDKCAVSINHNQVDFAGFAGEVTSKRFEAFMFKEFLAAFFAPSAAQLFIRRRPAFVRQRVPISQAFREMGSQQISYPVYRVDLVILRLCVRCAAWRA